MLLNEFLRGNSSGRMLLGEFTRRNSSKRRSSVKITQGNSSKRSPSVKITQGNAFKRRPPVKITQGNPSWPSVRRRRRRSPRIRRNPSSPKSRRNRRLPRIRKSPNSPTRRRIQRTRRSRSNPVVARASSLSSPRSRRIPRNPTTVTPTLSCRRNRVPGCRGVLHTPHHTGPKGAERSNKVTIIHPLWDVWGAYSIRPYPNEKRMPGTPWDIHRQIANNENESHRQP